MADQSPPSPSSSSWSRQPSASYSGAIPAASSSSNSRAPSPSTRSTTSSVFVGAHPIYGHSQHPSSALTTSSSSTSNTAARFAAATSTSGTMASAALANLLPPGENFLLPYNSSNSQSAYASTSSSHSQSAFSSSSNFGLPTGSSSVPSGVAATVPHSAPSVGMHPGPRSAYHTGQPSQRYFSASGSQYPSTYPRLQNTSDSRQPSARRPSLSPEQSMTESGDGDQLGSDNDSPMSFARSNERFMQSFYDPHQVKHRRRTTPAQLEILDAQFQDCSKPDMETRKNLAKQLDMTIREVQVWFQNRRAKQKKLDTRGPTTTGRVRSEGSDSSGSGYPYPMTYSSDRYSSYTTSGAPGYPQMPGFSKSYGQTGPATIDARNGPATTSGGLSYLPPSIRPPSGSSYPGITTRPPSSSSGSAVSYGYTGSNYSLSSDRYGLSSAPGSYGQQQQQQPGFLRPPMSSLSGSSGSSRSSSNDDYLSTTSRRGALPPALSKLSISPTMGMQPSSGTPFAPASAPSSISNTGSLPFSSATTSTTSNVPFMSEGSRSGATFPATLSYAVVGNAPSSRQSYNFSGSTTTAGGISAGIRDGSYLTSPSSSNFTGVNPLLDSHSSKSLQSRDQSGLGLGSPPSTTGGFVYPSGQVSAARRGSIAGGYPDLYSSMTSGAGSVSSSSFQDGNPYGSIQPSGAPGYSTQQQQQSGYPRRTASGSYLSTVLEQPGSGTGSVMSMASEGGGGADSLNTTQPPLYPSASTTSIGDHSAATSPDPSERGLSSAEGTPGFGNSNKGLMGSSHVKSPPNLHAPYPRSASRSGSNSGLLNQYEGL